ncbi:MAG: hypothetical protein AAFQ37_09400 [Bacteroidota bacterium]
MKTNFSLIFLLLTFVFVLASCGDDEGRGQPPHDPESQILILGTSESVMATPVNLFIRGIDRQVTGTAYIMPFFDEITGERLGTATDIHFNAEPILEGGLRGESIVEFAFDDDGSTLVLHNFFEALPIEDAIFHATVKPELTTDNLVGGTGRFANVTGGATLDAILDFVDFNNSGFLDVDGTYHITINF